MTNATDDPKRYCLQLVQTHLASGWKSASLESLQFRRIFGGCTSLIFYLKAVGCQPEELIVRFHYANDEETNLYDLKFTGEAGETLIFHILSKIKFGPKLYSVFNGGRIEEYIPSVQLPDEDVVNGTYHEVIIRKIAFVHSLDMPIVQDEKWITRFIQNYQQSLTDLQAKREQVVRSHSDDVEETLRKMLDFDLLSELFWFRAELPKLRCRLVFAHNDITKRNVLVRTVEESSQSTGEVQSIVSSSATQPTIPPAIPETPSPNLPIEQKVVLIDFGDCAYNYRGLDLADYLRCRVSITSVIRDGEAIVFYDEAQIRRFCAWYLDEFEKHSQSFDPAKDNLEQLLMEVYYFLLLSDLMTILYITLSAERSNSHKANWAYAIKRIALYEHSKAAFIEKYGDRLDLKEPCRFVIASSLIGS